MLRISAILCVESSLLTIKGEKMSELNLQQQDIVKFLNGIAIVVAIPGSGKTRTLTERIIGLVEGGVAPDNILGVTFTKNAANTMKHRLQAALGLKTSRLSLSTLHSFCYQVLRAEGALFELLEEPRRLSLLRKTIGKQIGTKPTLELVLSEIRYAKNHLMLPGQYRETVKDDLVLSKVAKIYTEYESTKDQQYWLDFDDLLLDTYLLLATDQEVRRKYCQKYQHILVDEYQDTNPAQLELIKILVNDRANRSFFVVGDDAQSIYSFTGASVQNIIGFREVFPTAHTFTMDLNYRSTPQILKACGNLISHNRQRIEKDFRSARPDGDEIIHIKGSSEDDEAARVADEIEAILNRNLFKLSDIAILYRANFQSRPFEEIFLQRHIPYHVEKGRNFFQQRAVRRLLEYLKVINDPLSPEADKCLLKVLNVPDRSFSRRFTSELSDFADKQKISIYEALKTISPPSFNEKTNARQLYQLLDTAHRKVEDLSPTQIIGLLSSLLEYDSYLAESGKSQADESQVALIDQLQISASRFEDLSSFLDYASQFSRRSVANTAKSKVRLMTVHKSKGMEFPVVFLVGLGDGILPMKDADLEEERRIAFVGMSRASSLLHLSYPARYNNREMKASQFLSEIRQKTESC